MNLSENSNAYYSANKVYLDFCKAEDYPNKTIDFLKPHIKNKKVLDAGCGTGKYIYNLKSNPSMIIGLDQSINQLNEAYALNKDIRFICGNLVTPLFKPNSFDVSISCWVLGTIIDDNKRLEALNNLKKYSKNIYLLENAQNSEFEYIRDRTCDNRTKSYNDWLIKNDFKSIKTINTYFKFETIAQAKQVFYNIWGGACSDKIKSAIIEHDIQIFHFKGA